MDINLAREIVTVASFTIFVVVVVWAWSARNRDKFEEAARLPLDDDETLSPTLSQGRGRKS